jgi:DNA-binding transcriptional MerR regulator
MQLLQELHMRMRDLALAADLPRTTIHHYLREGLLPDPKRTAANASTYGPEHLERLELLKALRGPELGPLPLEEIRLVLALVEQGLSPAEAVELMALGRRGRAEESGGDPAEGVRRSGALSLRDVARRTGRDSRELRHLIDAGLLASAEDGGSRGFDAVDLAAVSSCARLLDAGLAAADLKPLADLLGEVKAYETVLEDLVTSTKPQPEADAIRATMRGAFRDLHVYLLARARSE